MEVREGLAKRFADDGTSGVFIAYDVAGHSLVASEAQRSTQAILPASTFKVANSIAALETGVVADPDKDVFKWDGVTRGFPDWNRDHTLRTAIRMGEPWVLDDPMTAFEDHIMKSFALNPGAGTFGMEKK